ncbi:unnamed protein product [Rodentolepis nana]|uniref:RNase H type-1 domain-containing protein n=1 Tax=Rodentolepis nana TaxID=102285 RepID=A0A0R3TFJ3_RODNA|nr:unnamed protein product [Rodentolepis nana]
MRSLALETNADQWIQVFTDGSYMERLQVFTVGSYIENQTKAGAGVYSELFSFYAEVGHISERNKNQTVILQWIPGHCGIKGNELADTLAKKGTTILQCMDRPMSFHKMKALIRREHMTSRCNELKARTKDKQWTVAFSEIAELPRIEAVAEFGLRTGRDCLAKHLHRLGVHTQPTCPLSNLQEEMVKTQLIRCPALKTTMETQRYWEAIIHHCHHCPISPSVLYFVKDCLFLLTITILKACPR